MNDLILDGTIFHAGLIDWWSIQEKGRCAAPACFDLLFRSEHLRLTQAAMSPQGNESDAPVLRLYDRWAYGIERNGNQTEHGKPQVLGFPIPHVNGAKERNPDLVIYNLDYLLEDGLSPVTAKIGIPQYCGRLLVGPPRLDRVPPGKHPGGGQGLARPAGRAVSEECSGRRRLVLHHARHHRRRDGGVGDGIQGCAEAALPGRDQNRRRPSRERSRDASPRRRVVRAARPRD